MEMPTENFLNSRRRLAVPENMLYKFYNNAISLINRDYYTQGERKKEVFKLKATETIGIIGELKFSSPSNGQISSKNVNEIRDIYCKHGLRAISVLTEPNFFSGNLEYLGLFRECKKPLLMKDFIISPKQITSGYSWGADIILMIIKLTRMFDIDETELINYAHSLDLQVILEVNNIEELNYALKLGGDFIGINSRDLSTLKIDKSKFDLIKYVKDFDSIAMSSIESVDEIKKLEDMGFKFALVGTYFMKNPEVIEEIEKFYG